MYLFDASYEDLMISYSDTRVIWISLDVSVRVTCLNFCHLCLQEVLLWRKPVIKKKLSDKTMMNSTCKHSWKAVWVIRSSVYSTVWPHTYSRWHCRPRVWGDEQTHTHTHTLQQQSCDTVLLNTQFSHTDHVKSSEQIECKVNNFHTSHQNSLTHTHTKNSFYSSWLVSWYCSNEAPALIEKQHDKHT